MPPLLQPVALAFLYAISLLLFFLPGTAVSLVCAARRKLSPVEMLVLTIVSSATFGYIAFWIYFGSKLAGEIFSYLLTLASAAILARSWKRLPVARSLVRELASPVSYLFFVGLCYLSMFYMFSNPFQSGADVANFRFFDTVRAGDNLIPLFFAEKIYGHQPLSPICCNDWLSSDRPPLQAGIFLLQRPFRLLGNVGLQYQLLASGLQCLWICGMWALLTTLETPKYRMAQALGFLIFSGFMFYNSVYVWPKLLAAAFVLFVVAILLEARKDRRSLTLFEILLAAISFSLAMMAHPGSIFSLPAIVLLWLPRARGSRLSTYAWAAFIVVLFVAPWMSYQKFYDPPGNRLLKMHLAGVNDIDSRSTWQALKDSYGSRPLAVLLSYKMRNLTTLLGPQFLAGFGFGNQPRALQRDYISNAIGIINAGWLVAGFSLIRKKTRRALPRGELLIAVALVNFLIWALVMFGPAQTFTTHSSFADILVLSVGLLGFVLLLHPAVLAVLFTLQVLNFFITWAFFKPAALPLPDNAALSPTLHWPLLIAGLLCAAALIWQFGASYFHTRAPEGTQAATGIDPAFR